METFFEEMKRYVRFGPEDEAALRAAHRFAAPHFVSISESFYARLDEHDQARHVFTGPEQVERLKRTLVEWMDKLFIGPWDEAYYEKRARIGRMHVKIALPQRYMFGAMNLIRHELTRVTQDAYSHREPDRVRTVRAVGKIIDLELAIMLETYREAFVDQVQMVERMEKGALAAQLALSEARYEEIVDKSEAIIVTTDSAGGIVVFNRRAEQLTGIRRDDARGQPWLALLSQEAEREELRRLHKEVLSGRRVSPYESTITPAGGATRRIRWHFTTLPGVTGPVLCTMGLDVTEEHALALRTRQAERLAALGTMAAGLAHEIRNPLNSAHLQLTLLQRRIGRLHGTDVSSVLEAAGLAATEIQRLAQLVEEFLQFARPQPLRLMRGDLRSTAETILALLQPEATTAGVHLALEAQEPVLAEYDDERLKQVIWNLVRNAMEATLRGGRVTVRLGVDDARAVLEVEDDGRGLPSPDAPIFEPFYTTKENGTGLGLAIVHRIVSNHGGSIRVDSRPGRTVFAVSLPIRAD